jgi:hypothetical protein
VEKLKQRLCNTPDQSLSLPGRSVWSWFLHRADTKIVQERLQSRAEELFLTAPQISHKADVVPLIAELWRAESVGPRLHSVLAEYGKPIRGVVAAGGGNLAPAQQEEIRRWTGATVEGLATERTLMVIEGSVFAFDLAPTGSLDRCLVLEIEHEEGAKQMEILAPYRRAQAGKPVKKTYSLMAGDTLRVAVKVQDKQGEEMALATCRISSETHEEVTVITQPDPSGILRILLRRDGAECPLWDLRL